jgi:hypothetical protein
MNEGVSFKDEGNEGMPLELAEDEFYDFGRVA